MPIPVRPAGDILVDAQAVAAHQLAIVTVNEMTDLGLYLELDPRAPFVDVQVFTHVIPGIANAAEEVDQPTGGAAISFDSLERARRAPIVLHELLHYVGLKAHSTITTEVMCGGGGCDPNRWVSARERDVIAWLMTQPAGPLPAECRRARAEGLGR